MSERFYVNLPLVPGPFLLEGPEAHHLAAVSRIRAGAEVRLFNGDGREYPARVTHVAKREVSVEILRVEAPARELPFTLEVAASMPKGDRAQFLIEKLTELGVTTFVPLVCHRSNVHPRESKREKLERWVIEASKQCGRNVLMRIEDVAEWQSYVSRLEVDKMRILAHPCKEKKIGNPGAISRPLTLAIGPEGGFTEDEVALGVASGWETVSLGPRILRVETAALVLVAAVTSCNES